MLNQLALISLSIKIIPSKQLFGIIFFCAIALQLFSQNLIVNPSFENFTKPCKWDHASYEPYTKFKGWVTSNQIWQFHANCFSQTSLAKGGFRLVKDKVPFHNRVAVSNNFGWATKQDFLRLDFLHSGVEIMVGTLNDTLLPGQKYYFSYHLSPSYNAYYSQYPNGERFTHLSMTTSNFVFSSLTTFETSQIVKRKYRYEPPNNGFPEPDYINPPKNYMDGNIDSAWNEVRGVFTADTFATHFYFGSNGNWWRNKKEGCYAYNKGINYSDTVGIKIENISFNGLYIFDAFTLIPYPELGDTVSICSDQVTLDPKTPKNRLVWFDGDTTSKTKVVTEPGTYWVTARTQFSSVTDTIVVLSNDKTIWPDTTAFCLGSKKELEINDAETIPIWNNTDTAKSYSVQQNEQIVVHYTNEQGCTTELSTYAYLDSVTLSVINNFELCETESLNIIPQSLFAKKYLLNNLEFIDSITIKNSGNYILIAQGKYCKDSSVFNVYFEGIESPFPKSKTFCFGDVVEFENTSKYSPNPDIYFENLDHDTTVYYQWEQDICGLLNDSLKIKLVSCNCQAFIPNAFTPNNNGLNDAFKIVIPCPVDFYEFMVFNRWGQRIFETRDINTLFTNNGLPIGTYFYLLNYETEDGQSFSTSGNIDVLK